MKVVVLGGAGFLGSHMVLRHLKKGDETIAIDNFSTSEPESQHLELICSLGGHVIEGSIDDESVFSGLNNVDMIYNFACPASPPLYQAMALKTLDTCYLGTKNTLEFAKNRSVRVLHASTSEIYGDPEVSPQCESYRGCVNTWGVRANYDEGKRVSETVAYEYKKLGVDVRVVRIFNTYGPHMHPNDGRVVTNFVKQALKGDDITIYGDGLQTRSFCYVDDLIDAVFGLASLKQGLLHPVNVGNPNEFTIKELAEVIIKKCNSKSKIVYKELPEDDPKQRRPNIDLVKSLTGWEPKIGLDVGTSNMIRYMKTVI